MTADSLPVEKLNHLIDFMAKFDKLTFGKSFCFAVENFLKDYFDLEYLFVYSIPNDVKISNKSELEKVLRIIWNKKNRSESQKQAHMNILFDALKDEHKSWSYFDQGAMFTLSKNEKQTVIALATGPKLPEKFWETLVVFFESQSKRQIKFDEIRKLEHLVHVDDVTGLFNQRKLFKDLDEAVDRYNNFKEEFAVLFIDIDHFKSVNDGHGHLVGTQILVDMASILRNCLRETDLIYRYGGDEFVLIVRDVNLDLAKIIGHRILDTVKNSPFMAREKDIHEDAEKVVHLTVSIGISLFPRDAKTRDDIIAQADKMMYQAKESGRGRVCLTSELGI
ncbi:MAG: hypothetical protein Fur0010_02540 [Bdellovibrio sp.]